MKAAAKNAVAKARASTAKAKAKTKATTQELKLLKKESGELKRALRNHRFRNPESGFAIEYQDITSSKKTGKIKSQDMEALLVKFKLEKKAQTKTAHQSKQYEANEDASIKRKIDFRKLCSDNNMDPLESNLEVQAENEEKIAKLIALDYYSRKPLKGKDLQAVVEADMPESAQYVYYVLDVEEIARKGTSSASGYAVTADMAEESDATVAMCKLNILNPCGPNVAKNPDENM